MTIHGSARRIVNELKAEELTSALAKMQRIAAPDPLPGDVADSVCRWIQDCQKLAIKRDAHNEEWAMSTQNQQKIRPAVSKFADEMERVLLKHDDEKGERGWENETVRWMVEKLREETDEVCRAFDNCDPEEISRESIDVANVAMMLWSLCGNESEK
jgi:NTP pyrophosphatase (non-canonical NTP hydrolase)